MIVVGLLASQAELGSASSEEERNTILKTYLDWEWNFFQKE